MIKSVIFAGVAGVCALTAGSALAECDSKQEAVVGKAIAAAAGDYVRDERGQRYVDLKSCDGGSSKFDARFRYSVERGYEQMVDRLARLPAGEESLAARVATVVRALWAGYDAANTRASLEILLATRGDEAFRRRSIGFMTAMHERIDRLWMGTFWDAPCPRSHHIEAQRTIFTALNGLALERILVPGAPGPDRDLERLAHQLVFAARAVDAQPAAGEHVHAVVGRELQMPQRRPEDDALELGVRVLEREVQVPGVPALHARELALDPDVGERRFDEGAERRRQLRDGQDPAPGRRRWSRLVEGQPRRGHAG